MNFEMTFRQLDNRRELKNERMTRPTLTITFILVKLSSKEEEKNTKLSPKQIFRIEIIIIIARVKKIHNKYTKQTKLIFPYQ